MKKIIFLLTIVFIQSACYAQTRLVPGELKGKSETFNIDNVSIQVNGIKRIGIDSKSNKYNNGIPYSKAEKDPRFLPMNFERDIHVDNDAIKEIVYTVLSKKLAALKANKEDMNIIFKFEPSGKLTDLGYTLKANTLITLEEIESIDLQLREKIKATFTGKQYLQYIAIMYNPRAIEF